MLYLSDGSMTASLTVDSNDSSSGFWTSDNDSSSGTWVKSSSGGIEGRFEIETGLLIFEDDTDG